ncbi:8-oxo-dGTP pyrophosphatase MutT, NUDIX family [Paenibacillus uliginis N3/975]|uniref:8-oxo-dGTP pyrophosphatase MutT, NUDIX family n=1 Tax=Paenibacillus uliginis N3/975 TaxID=1313296 RepID=A0A1X7HT19_9BACL|nr:NUDIX domain-containing protein [Paenibacillus uliginis]SMF92441.1 8-oxo-dGTP pyrophosphatase MutT, NUDIX family [Paenibacillus uliginis N3/975]
MKPIRNSAKAVIIQNERVLLTKNVDQDGIFYLFPGGGQEKYEELKDAVVRECIEEIGCSVKVKDILFIREYIGKNHQFAEWDADIHQVEFYFECEMETKDEVFNGHNPDDAQIGVEWIELARMNEIRVYPDALVKPLMEGISTPRYIGDSN